MEWLRQDGARTALAVAGALAVHLGLTILLMRRGVVPVKAPPSVPVRLVEASVAPPPEPEPERPPPAEPPVAKPPPQVAAPVAMAPSASMPVVTAPSAPDPAPPAAEVPDFGRWAVRDWDRDAGVLEPVVAVPSLDCDPAAPDCRALRANVLADAQMTPTERIWMPERAWRGMGAEYVGMSEVQIRDRLGLKTQGQNGFVLLPGIAIDGPLWDALHGVNKSCVLELAITGPKPGKAPGPVLVRECDTGGGGPVERPERFRGSPDDTRWARKGWVEAEPLSPPPGRP